MKLGREFYLQTDVVNVARQLIGKMLFTNFNQQLTAGIITETEAYNGIHDRASHAYGERRTQRTEVMYSEGGLAYVYLCYGIHTLFNIVTNKKDIPQAVLIRAIQPVLGVEIMERRRNQKSTAKNFSKGPGTVSSALGIHYSESGVSLLGDTIWIEDKQVLVPANQITAGPRIGVDYAGADALLPYRFTTSIKF